MPTTPPSYLPILRPAGGRRCGLRMQAARGRPSGKERVQARGSGGTPTSWEQASQAFLARPENRYCACGCGRIADMVDHRIAHKGDRRLFWDRANWQPMNRRCNSRKAARQEGGFGNPTREARP